MRLVGVTTIGDGDVVIVGDRRLWSPFTAIFETEPDGPELRLSIELRDGSPIVRKLVLGSFGTDGAVRPKHLRLRLDDLVEDAVAEAALIATRADPLRDSAVGRRELAADPQAFDDLVRRPATDEDRRQTRLLVRQSAKRPRRKKIDDDMLREVAEVYRAHVNDRPMQAVREHFRVQRSTAAAYVQRAREAEFLGESLAKHGRPGVAGEIEPQ